MYWPAQKVLLKWCLELQTLVDVLEVCSPKTIYDCASPPWENTVFLYLPQFYTPLKNQTLQTCTITVILCKLILHGNYVRKQLHRSAGCHSETRVPPQHSHLHGTKFENTPSWLCRWIPWTQDPSSPAAGLETTLFTKTELIMFCFQWLLSRNCYHWLFGHAENCTLWY